MPSQGGKLSSVIISYYVAYQGDRWISRKSRRQAGQAMVEYVIVAGVLEAMVAVLSVFLYTFREQSGRVLDLVASEYP